MAYETKRVKLKKNATSVAFPWLAYTRVHRVMREGLTLRPVSGTPTAGTREFKHDPAAGSLTFGVPGSDPGSFSLDLEELLIIYEV